MPKPKRFLLLYTTNSGDWNGLKNSRVVFEAKSLYHSGRVAKRFLEWRQEDYKGEVRFDALLPFEPIGNSPNLFQYYDKLPDEFKENDFKTF